MSGETDRSGTIKIMKDAAVARTYDADGLRRRAACLCFKDRTEKEILLISSTHDVEKWIVPGGGIDPGEESVVAAEREALEEAGATGVVDRLLGIFEIPFMYFSEQGKEHTDLGVCFLCPTSGRPLDGIQKFGIAGLILIFDFIFTDRRRQWFPLNDAKRVLSAHKPLQVSYINVAEGMQITP